MQEQNIAQSVRKLQGLRYIQKVMDIRRFLSPEIAREILEKTAQQILPLIYNCDTSNNVEGPKDGPWELELRTHYLTSI